MHINLDKMIEAMQKCTKEEYEETKGFELVMKETETEIKRIKFCVSEQEYGTSNLIPVAYWIDTYIASYGGKSE